MNIYFSDVKLGKNLVLFSGKKNKT